MNTKRNNSKYLFLQTAMIGLLYIKGTFWVFYGIVVSSGSPVLGCWKVGYVINSGVSCDHTYLSPLIAYSSVNI